MLSDGTWHIKIAAMYIVLTSFFLVNKNDQHYITFSEKKTTTLPWYFMWTVCLEFKSLKNHLFMPLPAQCKNIGHSKITSSTMTHSDS